MADVNSTPGRTATARKRPKVSEALPAYGVSDGVLSWRHGLRARERNTVDRALAVLGAKLRGSGSVLNSPNAVKVYLRLQLAAETRERFGVLFLNSQHRVIAFEIMFTGTLTQTSVYPREIVLAALRHHAAAVVLTHNHPSGTAQPSRADEALTQALKGALQLVDVRVLDHVIIGGDDALSMAERGLV
jgi:DNA repair protein RadC